MRILQICHRVPYPPIDGGNIVMMNMALALSDAGNEVHQFALNTNKHFVETNSIPEPIRLRLFFRSSRIDTKVTAGGLFFSFFKGNSYNVSRFFDAKAEEAIASILSDSEFDVVQLETLFAAPYIDCIRKNSKAKIVLRAHNVEHVIWERLSNTENNTVKKLLFRFLASRLKTYELQVLKKIDVLVPITPVDEEVFKKYFHGPVLSLPMCMDISEYNFDESQKSEMCLFHLASMDWMPNREAVEWFLKECWPKIHNVLPQLNLYLAGRDFPKEIIDAGHPSVRCEGRIENAYEYMSGKQIMIVPLHSGSGMRVKIIQGMALGKTIISTTVGAEGIPAENEKNILIADTPDEFVSAVMRCIENQEWCRQIGSNARKFAEENFSNDAIGKKLTAFLSTKY